MNNDTAVYLLRIDQILSKLSNDEAYDKDKHRPIIEASFLGTMGIVGSLYGPGSPQVKILQDAKIFPSTFSPNYQMQLLGHSLVGILINIREEIEQGLIRNLAAEASGIIIGDILSLAKTALKEGHISVAAVLASASLEDAMKQKAEELGLITDEKTLSEIINALKGKSFFKGAQVPIVASYVSLRNAAMHAKWDKIQESDVGSLIGFLEPFLLEHFS